MGKGSTGWLFNHTATHTAHCVCPTARTPSELRTQPAGSALSRGPDSPVSELVLCPCPHLLHVSYCGCVRLVFSVKFYHSYSSVKWELECNCCSGLDLRPDINKLTIQNLVTNYK